MRGLVVLLFAGLLLAGCVTDAPPEETGAGDDGQDDGQGGAAKTDAGEVTVQQSGGQWIARRTETSSGAFPAGGDVSAATANGDITVRDGRKSGFLVTASLWARGDTEQEARTRLAGLRLDVGTDAGVGATVRASGDTWNDRGGSLAVRLPTGDVGAVEADTTNGAVDVDGLVADSLSIDTSNGRIDCDVTAGTLDIGTSNGAIDCTATVDDAAVRTTNGPVTLAFHAAASGSWDIDSSNGAITLTVAEDTSRGYDVQAATTNGGVDFRFDDTEEVSSSSSYTSESRHERTRGYTTRSVQTAVTLDTTNGSITAGS